MRLLLALRQGARVLAVAAVLMSAAFVARDASAVTAQLVQFPGNGVTLQGWLYLPPQPGARPAVVALHGCAGLINKGGRPSEAYDDWGKRLADRGFVVLFPDSFASRGLGSQCRTKDPEIKSSDDRVDDAKAGLAYLAGRPNVKTSAISLVGWSNGGATVLDAVRPVNVPATKPDFARAIALYPGCMAPTETGNWQTRLPLLIMVGAADDWTPAKPCQDLTAAAKKRGEPVTIKVYPQAYHEFDYPNRPVTILTGLAHTPDDSGKAHVGGNATARADALHRVPAFLAQ